MHRTPTNDRCSTVFLDPNLDLLIFGKLKNKENAEYDYKSEKSGRLDIH